MRITLDVMDVMMYVVSRQMEAVQAAAAVRVDENYFGCNGCNDVRRIAQEGDI